MKPFLTLGLFIILLLQISCSAQGINNQSNISKNQVIPNTFIFKAERANPSLDGIRVLSQTPGRPTQQILELNDNYYGIELKADEVNVMLPFYGRLYTATRNTPNTFQFTSKKFTVKREDLKKKTVFTIRPSDYQYVSRLIIEVYSNGKAYVSVDSTDRTPISYDGRWENFKE